MEPTVPPKAGRAVVRPRVAAVHVPTPLRAAGTVPPPRVAAEARDGDLHVHVRAAPRKRPPSSD